MVRRYQQSPLKRLQGLRAIDTGVRIINRAFQKRLRVLGLQEAEISEQFSCLCGIVAAGQTQDEYWRAIKESGYGCPGTNSFHISKWYVYKSIQVDAGVKRQPALLSVLPFLWHLAFGENQLWHRPIGPSKSVTSFRGWIVPDFPCVQDHCASWTRLITIWTRCHELNFDKKCWPTAFNLLNKICA